MPYEPRLSNLFEPRYCQDLHMLQSKILKILKFSGNLGTYRENPIQLYSPYYHLFSKSEQLNGLASSILYFSLFFFFFKKILFQIFYETFGLTNAIIDIIPKIFLSFLIYFLKIYCTN